jgi:CelD/BcsL family acetyltransferase involved in cellulose biosynthesis
MSKKEQLTCKIVHTVEELQAFNDEWKELLTKSDSDIPFLTFEWFRIWIQSFAPREDLRIYVVFQDSTPVCIFPLYKTCEKHHHIPFHTLSFLANAHSSRSDILFLKEANKGQIFSFLLEELFKAEKFDYIKVPEFPTHNDSNFKEIERYLIQKNLKYSLEEEKKPPLIYVKSDWDSFFKGIKGHFRRNLQRRIRNAQKTCGELRHTVFDPGVHELKEWINRGLELEHQGWKGKAGSSILSQKKIQQFYLNIAEHFSQNNQLYSSVVTLGDQLAAFNFSFIYNNTFYLIKVAYNESLSNFSPGQIMIYFLLQEVFEKGLKKFDFLGPSMPWKLDWTNDQGEQHTFYIYSVSIKGVLFFFENIRLLPLLRKSRLLRYIKTKLVGG